MQHLEVSGAVRYIYIYIIRWLKGNKQLDALFYVFISLLYMFRATQCSSSGVSIVSIHHLLYITLNCIPDGHLHTVIYTRWCIDTIDYPDDEHWVARKM